MQAKSLPPNGETTHINIMWGGIGVINLLEKNEIINRHLGGESKRQIARELGKSRQVISKYIAEYEKIH